MIKVTKDTWINVYTRETGIDVIIKLPDDSNISLWFSFEKAAALAELVEAAVAKGGFRECL